MNGYEAHEAAEKVTKKAVTSFLLMFFLVRNWLNSEQKVDVWSSLEWHFGEQNDMSSIFLWKKSSDRVAFRQVRLLFFERVISEFARGVIRISFF